MLRLYPVDVVASDLKNDDPGNYEQDFEILDTAGYPFVYCNHERDQAHWDEIIKFVTTEFGDEHYTWYLIDGSSKYKFYFTYEPDAVLFSLRYR